MLKIKSATRQDRAITEDMKRTDSKLMYRPVGRDKGNQVACYKQTQEGEQLM